MARQFWVVLEQIQVFTWFWPESCYYINQEKWLDSEIVLSWLNWFESPNLGITIKKPYIADSSAREETDERPLSVGRVMMRLIWRRFPACARAPHLPPSGSASFHAAATAVVGGRLALERNKTDWKHNNVNQADKEDADNVAFGISSDSLSTTLWPTMANSLQFKLQCLGLIP